MKIYNSISLITKIKIQITLNNSLTKMKFKKIIKLKIKTNFNTIMNI